MYTLPPRSAFSSSVGNGLFNSASLDLPFAKTKSLFDATTGSNLVDFTRQSSGTYVGSWADQDGDDEFVASVGGFNGVSLVHIRISRDYGR